MNRQLQAIVDDLEAARTQLHALWASVPRDAWHSRPGAGRWSAGECVGHLNLASRALLPLLQAAVATAPVRRSTVYRRDALGWVVAKAIAPSSPLKVRSAAAFEPAAAETAEAALSEFDRLQDALVACVRAAEGRAIDTVTVASPFHHCLRYNLYSAFKLVAQHQHRHLGQARRAATTVAPMAEPAIV